MGILFLGLFSDSFFSQKTETLLWRVSGVCYDFSFDSVFFMFQNKYKVKSLNHDENIKTLMLKKSMNLWPNTLQFMDNRINKVVWFPFLWIKINDHLIKPPEIYFQEWHFRCARKAKARLPTLQTFWLQKLKVFTVLHFRLQFHCNLNSQPLHTVGHCS